MESRMAELNEQIQQGENNQRVNREQWEIEREKMVKEKEQVEK
jgi:hypothetical protein